MEEESKSCTGVLLRTDLIRHGHPTLFGRWAWMATPCQSSSQMDTRARFLFFFHNVLLHYQHHISKNWRVILPCSYFWNSAQYAGIVRTRGLPWDAMWPKSKTTLLVSRFEYPNHKPFLLKVFLVHTYGELIYTWKMIQPGIFSRFSQPAHFSRL